jgi:hypothetical protein
MAVPEKAYAGPIEHISDLIAACQFLENSLFLAERLPQQTVISKQERQDLLCFRHFDPNIPFDIYTSGRIFNEDFELRWEKSDDKTAQSVYAVYVGKEQSLPLLKPVRDVRRNELPRYYYLFGTRLEKEELEQIGEPAAEGDFAEVRIPRLLRYPPLDGAKRVRLGVYEYLKEGTGEVLLFRFSSLEPAE